MPRHLGAFTPSKVNFEVTGASSGMELAPVQSYLETSTAVVLAGINDAALPAAAAEPAWSTLSFSNKVNG